MPHVAAIGGSAGAWAYHSGDAASHAVSMPCTPWSQNFPEFLAHRISASWGVEIRFDIRQSAAPNNCVLFPLIPRRSRRESARAAGALGCKARARVAPAFRRAAVASHSATSSEPIRISGGSRRQRPRARGNYKNRLPRPTTDPRHGTRHQSRISSSSSNDGKNLGVTCLYAR